MNVLITGAAGFVGKYLVSSLRNTDHEVTGTDSRAQHDLDVLDVTKPEQALTVVQQALPNIIIHLAGYSSVHKSIFNPEAVHKINVEGTLNMLNACSQLSIQPKFILISSAHVYGTPKSLPVTEDAPLLPQSPYATSRVEQEDRAQKLAHFADIPLTILRGFNQIGPGQSTDFVVSSIAKQIADIERGTQDNLTIGNTAAKRDFTDVRDVIKAYILAMDRAKPETYNICSGTSLSIQQVLDKLISLSDAAINVEHDPARMRPSDIPDLRGDHSKFSADTGWLPDIPIDTTLKDVLEYWRKQ